MKNREQLLKELDNTIQSPDIINVFQDVIIKLKDRINNRKLMDAFHGKYQLFLFTDGELYFLANALTNVIASKEIEYDTSKIKTSEYFTDIDIEKYVLNTVVEKIINNEEMLILDGVYKTTDNQWFMPKLNAEMFKKLIPYMRYDFSQQREMDSYTTSKGDKRYRAKVYSKSVNGIYTEMKKNRYTPTALTINITQTDEIENKSYYDEENHTMTLHIDDPTCIIDGFHRALAFNKLISDFPDTSQVMQLNILSFNVYQSQEYIRQEGMKNPISKELLESYNKSDVYVSLASDINEFENSSTNMMWHKLATTHDEMSTGKYVYVAKFAEFLKDTYKVDDNNIRQKNKIKKEVINGLNDILSIYNADIKTYNKIPANYFYPFLYLTNRLNELNVFEELIEDIVKGIDYKKIEDLGSKADVRHKITKLQKKKINAYLDELIGKIKG